MSDYDNTFSDVGNGDADPTTPSHGAAFGPGGLYSGGGPHHPELPLPETPRSDATKVTSQAPSTPSSSGYTPPSGERAPTQSEAENMTKFADIDPNYKNRLGASGVDTSFAGRSNPTYATDDNQ